MTAEHQLTARVAYEARLDDARGIIAVTDLSEQQKTMTVTNGAEFVVGQLRAIFGIRGRRVLYRDTEGVWDELVHDGKRFTGFNHIGALDLESARLIVLTQQALAGLEKRGGPIGPTDVSDAIKALLDP